MVENSGKNKSVLIVEDSLPTRMIIRKAMEEFGYETKEAGNGQEALDILNDGAFFDLAMIDWNMPVMDGLQLVWEIQRLEEHKKMKLLMVTTRSELDEMLRALNMGASDYLIKPFSKGELADKLKHLGV